MHGTEIPDLRYEMPGLNAVPSGLRYLLAFLNNRAFQSLFYAIGVSRDRHATCPSALRLPHV
jgi:hypothetical protein